MRRGGRRQMGGEARHDGAGAARDRDGRVRLRLDWLGRASWRALALRFGFGGLVTAMAGWIGHAFGPETGGLFLAFPAILPAALTLIDRHTGRRAAHDSATGAAAGAIGLLAFGAVVWALAPHTAAAAALGAASVAWLAVSVLLWATLRLVAGDRAPAGGSPRHAARPADGA